MFVFLTIACLMVIGVFTFIYLREPRSLWLGTSFLAMFMTLVGTFAIYLVVQEQTIPVVVMAILFVFLILALPMLIILMFLSSGIVIVRREGLRPTNLLALAMAVLLFAYLTIWPSIGNLSQQTLMNILYMYISSLVVYVLVLLNLFTLTTALNLIHFRMPTLDYLVVLGAGLDGDQVTPLLASRIDKAIQIHQKTPAVKLIMTGGQGDDELVSEGAAMAAYAKKQGVPDEAIIIEDKAVNTEENIEFSRRLMSGDQPKFAVVSNNYHVFRALLLAKEQGLSCIGFGAKTKWYFAINAFIREFVGYLYLKRRLHLIVLTIFTIGFVLLQALLVYLTQYIMSA